MGHIHNSTNSVIMDRSSIFKQLGVGVRFDWKRFEKDAARLNGVAGKGAMATMATTMTSSASEKAPLMNGLAAALKDGGVAARANKKRKRKSTPANTAPESTTSTEETADAADAADPAIPHKRVRETASTVSDNLDNDNDNDNETDG